MPVGFAEQVWNVAAKAAVDRRKAANTPWSTKPVWGGAEGQEAWPDPVVMINPRVVPVPFREPRREARIIVPENWASLHSLQRMLVDSFGGYTVTQGAGARKDDDGGVHHDAVRVYDIAMEASPENIVYLRQIARWALGAFKQQAIYLRLPNGVVEFIS